MCLSVSKLFRNLPSGRRSLTHSKPLSTFDLPTSFCPTSTVIFFSMATSFTSAALGAEGVGKDVKMIVGNGYVPGHAELTLGLLRRHPRLRALFESRYAK